MSRTITIKDARLIYKNFSGAPDAFNRNGVQPNFSVVIPEEDVGYYRDDLQLNVKERITKDGNVFHYLRVKVGKYADIYLRDEDGTLALVEPEQYPMLDQIRLSKCDLSVSSREYSAGGRNGTTVYLAELFACKESKSELYREWMTPDLNGDD